MQELDEDMAMNERHKKVLEWKKEGKTFKEIGVLIGATRGRASQIYQIAKAKQEAKNNE